MGPHASEPVDIAQNFLEVRQRIHHACDKAGRSRLPITVIAVTKSQPLEVVRKAYALGLRHFGENRVQEAFEKLMTSDALTGMPGLTIHMIGHLQSNKVRKAVAFAASVDSLDSPELATYLDRAARDAGKVVRVLIEVNSSGESQKYGVQPDRVAALAEHVLGLDHLQLAGLMTIGPNCESESEIRAAFQLTRSLFEQVQRNLNPRHWSALSMGMSGDYEIAVEEGATEVRLGTALFGARA